MKRTIKRLFVPAVAICAFLLLSECQNSDSGGVTVSGTATSTDSLNLTTASISITSGGTTFVTQVDVPAPGRTGDQSVTYSIPGVPTGTYDVAIALSREFAWDVFPYLFTLSVDGVPQQQATDDGASPVRTFAMSGLSITDSTEIDLLIEPQVGQ